MTNEKWHNSKLDISVGERMNLRPGINKFNYIHENEGLINIV